MTKAQQKIEYRWDDFLADKQAGKISEEEPYDPPPRMTSLQRQITNLNGHVTTLESKLVTRIALGTNNWEYLSGRTVSPPDPTIRISGRSEMPSLEVYHEDLNARVKGVESSSCRGTTVQ